MLGRCPEGNCDPCKAAAFPFRFCFWHGRLSKEPCFTSKAHQNPKNKNVKKSNEAQEKNFLIYLSGDHLNPIFFKFISACEVVSTGALKEGREQCHASTDPRPGINTAAHLCSFTKKSEPGILKFGILSDDQI